MSDEQAMSRVQTEAQPERGHKAFSGDVLFDFLSTYGTVFALFIVVAIFTAISPRFISSDNIINILHEIATLTIVSIGLTICVAVGEFDLSVGTVASLAGIVVSGLIVRQERSALVAILAALGCGLAFGLLNSVIVCVLRIPSLITTLGTSAIAVGANFAYAKGDSIYGRFPSTFKFIGQGEIGPIPTAVVIAAVLTALAYVFLNQTRWGRYVVATGGNPQAARLMGINTLMFRAIGLTAAGLCAALAGVVLTSYLGTGQPTGGDVYTLDALAAVFVGMTTVRPGQANIAGTIVGVLILGVIANGLNLVGAPFYLQQIVRGSILIASVSLAVIREEIRLF